MGLPRQVFLRLFWFYVDERTIIHNHCEISSLQLLETDLSGCLQHLVVQTQHIGWFQTSPWTGETDFHPPNEQWSEKERESKRPYHNSPPTKGVCVCVCLPPWWANSPALLPGSISQTPLHWQNRVEALDAESCSNSVKCWPVVACSSVFWYLIIDKA